MKKFAELFKKYRLRAEFETFASFGDALSEKGYHYEESIFSHWQKGTRIPNSRSLILKILEVFIERDAIQTVEKANEFLSSAGFGYLTNKELQSFGLKDSPRSPFQVPSEMVHFVGRKEIIRSLQKEDIQGKTILIYGQAGVGKTTLAIKLAHLFRNKFPDGVLWYRMETSKFKDILIAIAHMLREDLPKSSDTEIIASFVRSILARKRVLLIFDNVEKNNDLHLLLPYGTTSAMMILSRNRDLYLPVNIKEIFLESFTKSEILNLFEKIFDEKFIKREENILKKLGELVGNLPLAIDVLASQLKQSGKSPAALFNQGQKESLSLKSLAYENKNLFLALEVSFANLSEKARAVFLSLGIFEGKDFSVDAIAYMNGLSAGSTSNILEELHNASLIEKSLNNKFRIHPMIRKFIAERLYNPYAATALKIISLLFGFFTIFWIIVQIFVDNGKFAQHIFSYSYFIVALWGAIWGLRVSQRWGGIKSTMGKSILFFSLGLFGQVLGQVFYSFYISILKIPIPYPSIGDMWFFISLLLYFYAIVLLAKGLGISISLLVVSRHIFSSMTVVGVLACAYLVLFLQGYIFDWSNLAKMFFDFAPSFVDDINILIMLLLFLELRRTKKYIMGNGVFLFLIATSFQLIADYFFVYQYNTNTWAPGQTNDYMFLSAYLLMTFAILRLNSHMTKVIAK